MLSGILAGRARKAKNTNLDSSRSPQRPDQVFGTVPLEGLDEHEAIELEILNNALDTLASIFSDVRPEVFREMLTNLSGESRLELIIEALLTNKNKHVKGRWLPLGQQNGQIDNVDETLTQVLAARDRFQSARYKRAVKSLLIEEYRSNLSKSTVKAVLAENNFSYTLSRPVLLDLTTKTWRHTLSAVFLRRQRPTPVQNDHPLLQWDSERHPWLQKTASPELNLELEQLILLPLTRQILADRHEADRQLAAELNQEEAQQKGATFDCACCYSTVTFEDIVPCATNGHYVCSSCVRYTFKECLYGQGWSRSVDEDHGSLRCIAAVGETCTSHLPEWLVHRVIENDKETAASWTKFENRLSNNAITKSPLLVIKCPSCGYAEARNTRHLHIGLWTFLSTLPLTRIALAQALLVSSFLDYLVLYFGLVPVLIFVNPIITLALSAAIQLFLRPTKRIRTDPTNDHGQKFQCRRPACMRTSCATCGAAWHDPHTCHRSPRQALRTFVEAAVTDAVKRTCPECNLSFVKESGCNKMTCARCGYNMCWICRAHVVDYAHFCTHFRPGGNGRCRDCTRCDLWKAEDEAAVVRRAKKAAIAEWWEREVGPDGKLVGEGGGIWSKEDLMVDDIGEGDTTLGGGRGGGFAKFIFGGT